MHINRCRFAHNRLDCHKIFIHPTEIFFLVPHIAIHLFLKGFQFVDVQFLLRLGDDLRHLGVPTDIDLFCVVRPAGKGWVNVDQINLDTPLFQVGAGGDALTTNDHVAVGVLAHSFLLFHLIKGHSPLENHRGIVGAFVLENTVEIAEDGLAFDGFWDKGDVFNRHGFAPPFL